MEAAPVKRGLVGVLETEPVPEAAPLEVGEVTGVELLAAVVVAVEVPVLVAVLVAVLLELPELLEEELQEAVPV